jgi:hypothetical protein
MLSKIAWDLCAGAFEASRDQALTRSVRRSLQRFGVIWFWLALTLEGRAREVWRERAKRVDASNNDSRIPVLAAWSLPNNPKMRGLGLGRSWVVACPFCRHYHVHAPEEGSRPAHCHGSPTGFDLYALRYEGELPRGLWERFCLSAVDDKPRLLRPPYRDLQPDALEAA